jgi:acetoin utilization deacetylase AcuC-like enzyme
MGLDLMTIVHDPKCADYGSSMRPEQPARITGTVAHLRAAHPEWDWRLPPVASADTLLLAHTAAHLKRLDEPRDFDDDTPFFSDIGGHARRAVGAAVLATEIALTTKSPVFSLMRPPGHHATADQAMGFCYLNAVAIAVLAAQRSRGDASERRKLAVWDFDAHHGNGTESILLGRTDVFFASVHQSPGYPGTGRRSQANCLNWPIPPGLPRVQHRDALKESWAAVLAFKPDLIVVSAGFDAYSQDPITSMTLEIDDFRVLGSWLAKTDTPIAAVLEGGYSTDLPLLIDAFLSAWNK